LGIGSDVFATGGAFIGNEVPSARAAGQGYVGVAGQNNDPTAVYTNPGAMTSLPGTQITVGTHWENIHGAYQDDSGNTTKERVVNVAVPNFSMTQSFLDGKLSVGLGEQSPFGLETNWDGNSPLRYVATNSRLHMVDIMPAVAYKVHPMFSIGAGADYDNVFTAQLDKHVNNDIVNVALGSPTGGSPDAIASLRGTGADWGYHAGFVFQPTEQHAIGVTYHSKVNIRINGSETITGITGATAQAVFGGSNYTTSAYTDIVLPSNVQIGYAFKPNEKWHFEADTVWMHWSEAQDLNVRFPAATPNQQAVLGNMGGTTNITPLTLRDAWGVATGANYKANDTWELRSGFWYEPWAAPESTFSPAFADLTRYGVTAGTGYHLNQNITIDLAYSAVFFHNRTVHNSVGTNSSGIPAGGVPGLGIPSPDISGTYKDFANLVAVNFTYKFGAGK
jgi:long-chain fatty acid transport protein